MSKKILYRKQKKLCDALDTWSGKRDERTKRIKAFRKEMYKTELTADEVKNIVIDLFINEEFLN